MDDDQQQGTDTIQHMRETIDRMKQERDEARQLAERYQQQERQSAINGAFAEFGLDPTTGPGKYAAQAYDGEADPQQVQQWLTDEGFAPSAQTQPPAGMQQRVAQRQNLNRIERDGAPAGTSGQSMTVDEHLQLMKSDPQAARQAHAEGRVQFVHASSA